MPALHNKQNFESNFESYLLSQLKKIPFSVRERAFIVGFSFYIIYFLIALFSGQASIAFWSRMHLVQISFTACIVVSIYLWERFYLEFIDLLKGLENIIDDNKKYEEIINNTVKKFKSSIAILFSVPLMIISVSYFYLGIYPKIPDNFFPVPTLFHYLALLFSFFMLYLLGSKGFWYLYTVTQLYKEISQKSTVPFFDLLKQPFEKFSNFPFRISLYLFIIEATVLPILIYIVYFYNIKIGGGLMILGVLGLFLVISIIFYLFYTMNSSIIASISKSKKERLAKVIPQLEVCEMKIYEIKNSKPTPNNIKELERLLEYHAYLDRVHREVKGVPEKPPKFVRIFGILVSILPAGLLIQYVKLAIEQIISMF